MVSINVAEFHVHQGVEFNSDEPAAIACGGGGVLQTEQAAGIADIGGVRRDDEGKAAADRGGIEVGDGEGEEGGEAGRRRGPR